MAKEQELCTDCGARREERALAPSAFGGDLVCRQCEALRAQEMEAAERRTQLQARSATGGKGGLPWWMRHD